MREESCFAFSFCSSFLELQSVTSSSITPTEMALLVEGLGIGNETSIEEYVIGAAIDHEPSKKDKVLLYGSEGAGLSWVAKPVIIAGHSSIKPAFMKSISLVTLFDSIHERLAKTGSIEECAFSKFWKHVQQHI
ncbi:hypothetical protein S83_003541 [Arachis hypogaea]